MPTDLPRPSTDAPAFDAGLLSPVSAGVGAELADAAVFGALVAAETALVRAWAGVGVAPRAAVTEVSERFGWVGPGKPCRVPDPPLVDVVAGSANGGNPVIPLVAVLAERVSPECRPWVHRGATSQDILDSALMLVARQSGALILADVRNTERALTDFVREHRGTVAAARTLTQHAVPTTMGLRASGWLRGIRRAADRLDALLPELPAQLGGAGGTLASFVEIARGAGSAAPGTVSALVAAYAAELTLAAPEAPWHTVRWPVTELADALTQVVDALGVLASDVATLSRTEIGELAEGAAGGSSAMPQKRNPAGAVLVRSAALRAPQLAATLHLASALAGDERPDGAWHAEWPTLRELLRLTRGAAAQALRLVSGLRVDTAAVSRNLALTDGLIVAERLAIVLGPVLGAERVREIVRAAGQQGHGGPGNDLASLLRAEPELAEAGIDVAALLDPAQYLGLAAQLTEGISHPAQETT